MLPSVDDFIDQAECHPNTTSEGTPLIAAALATLSALVLFKLVALNQLRLVVLAVTRVITLTLASQFALSLTHCFGSFESVHWLWSDSLL